MHSTSRLQEHIVLEALVILDDVRVVPGDHLWHDLKMR